MTVTYGTTLPQREFENDFQMRTYFITLHLILKLMGLIPLIGHGSKKLWTPVLQWLT